MSLPFICPNCKQEAHICTTNTNKYYIRCDCGLCTPNANSSEEAAYAWTNMFRTTPMIEDEQLVIKRGEVYWCEVPPRLTEDGEITCIHYGRKPYVAIGEEHNCALSSIPLMVPITSNPNKKVNCFHQQVTVKGKVSTVLGEQVTPLPREYIKKYMTTLTAEDLKRVESSVRYALGFNSSDEAVKLREMKYELKELIHRLTQEE